MEKDAYADLFNTTGVKAKQVGRMLAQTMLDKIDELGNIEEMMDINSDYLISCISIVFNTGVLKRAMLYARNSGNKYSELTINQLTEDYKVAAALLKLTEMEEEE